MLYQLARTQAWLYDKKHDSMRPGYRHIAHGLLRLGTRVQAVRYRLKPAIKKGDRLNLGCGRTPLSGWVNADLNPFSGAELWIDLRDRWPIANNTIGVVYSRHCMEHFDEEQLAGILRQCWRVLEAGGGIRLGVPSLEVAVDRYLRRDFSFVTWLDYNGQPAARTFIRYITDNGNHPILLDYEYLAHLLSAAGFIDITRQPGGTSAIVDASLLPSGDFPGDWVTLYVEARKPVA